MDATLYQRNIGGDEEISNHQGVLKMFISPDTYFDLAKLHHQELIAEAERSRLLSRARRSRAKRSARALR
jgi:hypothetical protein